MAHITITTVNCPHCQTSYGPANAFFYGSPLKTCKKCGKQYVDRRYHEIALEGARQEDINPSSKENKKSAIATLIISIAMLFGGVLLLFFGRLSIILFLFGGLGIIISISMFKDGTRRGIEKKKSEIENELLMSVQRMQNPQYVQALRIAGYTIPEDFTPKTTLE